MYGRGSRKDISNCFETVQEEVKNLTKYQLEIERLSRKKFKFDLNSWFMYSVLGRKRYTVEELFDRELVSLVKMNVNLELLLEESKEELDELGKYKANLGREIEKKKVPSRKKGLTKLHEDQINKEAVIDLTQEVESVGHLYEMFHVSTMLSQRLYEKTRRIERYVNTTKRSYELLSQQQKSFSALQEAIHDISKLTIGVHTTLAKGVESMANISSQEQPYTIALDSPYPLVFPEWKVNDKMLSREVRMLEKLANR